MNLPIPVPSQTGGPQYAQDEVSCFQQLDSHNHTSGQGVQIPLDGLNINQNLDMNNYSVTDLKSVQFNQSVSSPGTSSLFMLGNNLYFRDGTDSFNVQITNGASVNVSGAVGFSGLPSGTASASFLPGTATFQFQSATNTGATTDIGPLKLRTTTAGSNAVTITPANPTNNYTLTLPNALPGSDSFLVASSVGNLSFQATSFVLPPGVMIMFGGTSAPTGWLFCDGSTLSTTTYSDLYAVLGAAYNIGNEVGGTFRLPDLRSKTAMGSGSGDSDIILSGTLTATTNITLVSPLPTYGMLQTGQLVTVSNVIGFTALTPGPYYMFRANPNYQVWSLSSTAAGAMTGTSLVNIGLLGETGSFTITVVGGNYQIGQRGGQNSVILSEANLPAHNHGGTTNVAGAHQHNLSFPFSSTPGGLSCFGTDSKNGVYQGTTYPVIGPQTMIFSAGSHDHNISSVGSYSDINNVPQFVTVNYIIKY